MNETIYEMLEKLSIEINGLNRNSINYQEQYNSFLEKIRFIQTCYQIAVIKKILTLSTVEKFHILNQINQYSLVKELLDDYLIIYFVGKDFWLKYKNSFIMNDKESKSIQMILNSDSIFIDDKDFDAELFDYNIKRIK